jgi:serine/threonine protein kinase
VSLRDLLSAGLTPAVAQRIGLEVADALQALHEQGASLGDLTPETILVTNKGRVVLLPTCVAGLARLSDPDEPRRCYMAPELDSGDVLPGTDVYALAAILSEVMGRGPARENTARARALSSPAESRPSAAELSSELRDSGDLAAPEEVGELVRRFCDGVLDDTDLGKRKPSLPPPMRLPSRTKTQPLALATLQQKAPLVEPLPPVSRTKTQPLALATFQQKAPPVEPLPQTPSPEAPDTSIAPIPLDPVPKRRRRAAWVVVAMITSAAVLIAFALASRPPRTIGVAGSNAVDSPSDTRSVEVAPVASAAVEEPAPSVSPARTPRRAPPKRAPRPAPTPVRAHGLDDLKPLPN